MGSVGEWLGLVVSLCGTSLQSVWVLFPSLALLSGPRLRKLSLGRLICLRDFATCHHRTNADGKDTNSSICSFYTL